MPFRLKYFDRAFCFGVLQHTPDPREAFMSIVRHVKPGGKVAADVYAKSLRKWLLNTKYWVRPLIDRSDPRALYEAVKRYVDVMWPISRFLWTIPVVGPRLASRLLVPDYSGLLGEAGEATLKEWAYLDAFDMLSPTYDKPQTLKAFRRWFEQAGLTAIDVRASYQSRSTTVGRAVCNASAPSPRSPRQEVEVSS
jgi:SAM-dependent methyltransferase